MLPIWLAALSVIDTGWSLDNGLARRPPMGWMPWATFLCETNCEMFPQHCISEELFRQMADRIVEDGFLAAGYNRIHIDDCWMERARNSNGELEADRKRFPNGIKWLARYMHDRKLELGIYADFGMATCMGFPGSIAHLEVDAKTFASWDVDYLKMDGCHTGIDGMVAGYARMERALNATGRSIIFSCSYPFYFLAQGLKVDLTPTGESCNLWRFYADVEGSWKSIAGIIHYVNDHQDTLAAAQKPGAWNDMDMIVAGLGSLTPDQARVQMSLWSIWSSPLIMSNDLRTLSSEFRTVLQNRDVIAIDQDPLGVMGKLVRKNDSVGIYVKPVTPVINGLTSFAIAVVNMNQIEIKKVRFTFESLGLVNIGGYNLRNLWTGQDFGVVSPTYDYHVELQPTSVSMIKLTIL
uniref:Alpha-galactosidase n=1 Tax=Haemonchus contortus TaxID=6289 RepID=A0A7I4YZ10_HAECO